MAGKALAEQLSDLLEHRARDHGLELVAVEVAGSDRRPLVRVFLDRAGGIDLEAICEANHWIAEVLDEGPGPAGAYTLEVSSPGIERPLRKLADFERFTGHEAVVQTSRPIDGRRRFTGGIVAVNGETIVLDVDGTEYRVPHGDVTKARLKVDIDFGEEGKAR